MHRLTIPSGAPHAGRTPLHGIAGPIGSAHTLHSPAHGHTAARQMRLALASIRYKRMMISVRSHPDAATLRLLGDEGYGARIASGGELARALAAGIPPHRIAHSGFGKNRAGLEAALDADIGRFTLGSAHDAETLARLAAGRGVRASALLRVDTGIGTHGRDTTGAAGIDIAATEAAFDCLALLPGLDLLGIAIDIGGPLAPFEATYCRIGDLLLTLRHAGHRISHIDLGGGPGLSCRCGQPGPDLVAYAAMAARVTRDWEAVLLLEPGVFIPTELLPRDIEDAANASSIGSLSYYAGR